MVLKVIIIIALILMSIGAIILWKSDSSSHQYLRESSFQNKEYRPGVEKIHVINRHNKQEIAAIDLSVKEGDFTITFNPHHIVSSIDKKNIWVTASAPEEQYSTINREAKEHIHVMLPSDQIIVINSETNKITKRINIGTQLNLADLVFTPDGKQIFVAAEKGNAIYTVDTNTYKVNLIQLPTDSNPHQLALTRDGTKLYSKDNTNSKMFLIATRTKEVKNQTVTEEINNLTWSKH